MSQEMNMNMNEKPILERKKTPLKQLDADPTIPRDEAPVFDASKPTTGRTIEITEVEYRFPEAGKEKYGEGACVDAECIEGQQNKPGVMQGAKDKLRYGVEGAKEKLHQGVEKAKEVLKPATTTTTTTTTTTPDSALTENKPGVFERVKGVFSSKDAKDSDYTYTDQAKPGVLQGAKNMVWQGVEKAKGLVSSAKVTDPTELHPGNGYEWKRVVGEQGQVCWVATNDWSSDSSNRGGIIDGAKAMVRSGVEKAKGMFTSRDAKESEFTDQSLTDQSKPGVLEGAKQKVWQGVEKAKSVLGVTSSAPSNEQHPGRSYTWHKTTGAQGQTHWVARNDWSNDSSNRGGIIEGAKGMVRSGMEKTKGVFTSNKDVKESEFTDDSLTDQSKPGVLEGAKQKVWQGVEKAKSVLGVTSAPSNEQHPGRSYSWHKTTGAQGQTHWEARNDWSNDSANMQGRTGVVQGAKDKVMQGKDKVMQGVEKAKGVFSSTKTTETTTDARTGTYA